MASKLGDRLADKFVSHHVNLLRLEASQRLAILKALKKLENRIAAKIQAASGGETFTLSRARALLREVTTVITGAYDGITAEHQTLLKALGVYEVSAVMNVVNRQVGVSLLGVGVPDSVIASMLKDDVVLGVPLKSYWEQQSVSLRNKFATEMRAGIFAGDTPDQLIRRVRGTKSLNFKDGIMQTARNGAEVVTRTAAQSIMNDARMAVYKENKDVLEGVQAQVTLDDRTTDICIARSGFAWDLNGNPLPDTETDEDFPGPPPWHPNCRSTLIPVVKSIGSLLKDKSLDTTIERQVKKIPKATQASMDGQVAGHLTYEDWLTMKEKQSPGFAKEVLGAGKYQLWKQDKISLRDLIDQRGRPLTLAQLRKVES